jgi:hypothetical protein
LFFSPAIALGISGLMPMDPVSCKSSDFDSSNAISGKHSYIRSTIQYRDCSRFEYHIDYDVIQHIYGYNHVVFIGVKSIHT